MKDIKEALRKAFEGLSPSGDSTERIWQGILENINENKDISISRDTDQNKNISTSKDTDQDKDINISSDKDINISSDTDISDADTGNINTNQETSINHTRCPGKFKLSRSFAGTAAAVLLVFLMLGVCAYAATGGSITDVFRDKKHASKEAEEKAEKEIIEQTLNITQRMEVYAPEIYACNEKYFVFAHLRGMVIYDRVNDKVASLVDLQETDCNNFDTSTRFTRIIDEGGKLLVFNEEYGKADKIYYEYDLSDLENPVVTKKKTSSLSRNRDLCKEWKKYEKAHYKDTFDSLPSSLHNFLNYKCMYSLNSFLWKAGDGSKKQSALLVMNSKENNKTAGKKIYYSLFTFDRGTKKYGKKKLNINVIPDGDGDVQKKTKLPKFVYKGSNKFTRAVCQFMCKKAADGYYMPDEIESVYIPVPMIYGKVKEKDGRWVVFARFYSAVFTRNGNVLEDQGGGTRMAKLYMKKSGDGYKVIKAEYPRDGSYLNSDTAKMLKGYPAIKKKIDNEKESRDFKSDIMLRKMLNMYLEGSGLGIVYYKNFGGDKQKITGYKKTLPAFSYSGSNTVKKAVCDYMCSKEAGWYKKNGGVYLPDPDIYYISKEGDCRLVFGNFRYETGCQYDDVLYLTESASHMGRMYLEPDGKGGYKVTGYRDADVNDLDWWHTLKDIADGYPVAMKKFEEYYNKDKDMKEIKKQEKALVRRYVKSSGADIKKFKGTGIAETKL